MSHAAVRLDMINRHIFPRAGANKPPSAAKLRSLVVVGMARIETAVLAVFVNILTRKDKLVGPDINF